MSRSRSPVDLRTRSGSVAILWLLGLAALGYAVLVLPGDLSRISFGVSPPDGIGGLGSPGLTLVLVALMLAAPVAGVVRGGLRRALAVMTCSVVVGFLAGAFEALREVRANEYLSQNLSHLALSRIVEWLGRSFLLGFAAGLLAIVAMGVFRLFGRFAGGRAAGALSALLPVAAMAGLGGLWIRRSLLEGAGAPLQGGAILLWAVACVGIALLVRRRRESLAPPFAGLRSRLLGAPAALVALVAAIGLTGMAGSRDLGTVASPKNLILVSLDTLRADHLGAYGYARATSPNLDAFARRSVLFRQAYSAAPWTLPSHMTLLTGTYPSRHGAVTKFNRLDPRHSLLSEILRNEGYATMAVTDGGFLDEHYGYDGFEVFDAGEGISTEGGMKGDVAQRVDRAIELLEDVGARPFFLFLHTYQVHCPYEPPAEFDLFSDPSYDGPIVVENHCVEYYREMQDRMDERDYEYVASKYDGEILYTDHHVGRFFDYLDSSGRYGDTVVILTSDHGENFGDHPDYQLGHSELYDHTMHVPLMLRGPSLPAGAVVEQPVEGVDVMPTLLDLLDVPWREKVDGRSLAGLATGGERGNPYVFGEKFPAMRMVRTDRFKLIQRAPGELELYDLVADPAESHDLIGEAPEEERLRAILDRWGELQDERLHELSEGQVGVPDRLHRKLEALGYVN